MSMPTTNKTDERFGENHFNALVHFIRLCRSDDAASDDRPQHVRRRAIKRHLRSAARDWGVDEEALRLLAIRELSGSADLDIGEAALMDEDEDFAATSARMGYDNMARATTRVVNGIRYEFGVVDLTGSALAVPGRPWAVIVHQDCDPDDPCRGYSGREDFASYDEALSSFNEEIGNVLCDRRIGL